MEAYITVFGTIDEIIFVSRATKKSVFALTTEEGVTWTCEGTGVHPFVGMQIMIDGDITFNELYHNYIVVSGFTLTTSSVAPRAMLRILCSIPGIGLTTAKKVVDFFGKDTYKTIFNTPERLDEMLELADKKKEKIIKYIMLVKILTKLCERSNFSSDIIQKLYIVGIERLKIISENLYNITYFTDIPFKQFDSIIVNSDYNFCPKERANAYTFSILKWLATKNHVISSLDFILKKARNDKSVSKEFKASDQEITESIGTLLERGFLAEEDNKIGIASYLNSTHRISEYIQCQEESIPIDNEQLSGFIDSWLQKKNKNNSKLFHLSEEQKSSINSLSNKFSIITGGPGTGKSFIIEALHFIITECLNQSVKILAPTGKAAIRLSRSEFKASTIHRELNYVNYTATKNKLNPILCDYIIVDESSMIDYLLLGDLLNAVKDTVKVILIGDMDQLPPVGIGRPFSDIIKADCVPIYTLTENFRQGKDGTGIIEASKAVIYGNLGKLIHASKDPSFYIHTYDTDIQIINNVFNLFSQAQSYGPAKLKSYVEKVLFLVATNSMKNKINNFVLKGIYKHATGFFEGMKVMNVENDYDKEVFNGEIGYVHSITNTKVGIKYEKSPDLVWYSTTEASFYLEPAYAITVHKAQGSEASIAYIVMDTKSILNYMWNKSMLYTAITRGKNKVHILKPQVINRYGKVMNPLIQGLSSVKEEYSLLLNLLSETPSPLS